MATSQYMYMVMKSTKVQTFGVYICTAVRATPPARRRGPTRLTEHLYLIHTCKHIRIVHNHALTVNCFLLLLDSCICV